MPQTNRRIESPSFPKAWSQVFDEIVPAFVKSRYSPRQQWKDKPFQSEDARFFFKGIAELSELLTLERSSFERVGDRGRAPDYFTHPRFRSAYLLYFLPLQAAKFFTLFESHVEATRRALEDATPDSPVRIADIGSGPGTASLALLIHLLKQTRGNPPPLEFHWMDASKPILLDGRTLWEKVIETLVPELRERISLHIHEIPINQVARRLPADCSWILAGNVLNELPLQPSKIAEMVAKWRERSTGAGILFVEPALRQAAHMVSQVRDQLVVSPGQKTDEISIPWGPCLHAGRCPLAHGRDWCHFSVPVQMPGQWFKVFSKMLSAERTWLKFVYVWLTAPGDILGVTDKNARLVISDPIRDGAITKVLLCEPNRTGYKKIQPRSPLRRGDIISKPSTSR